MNSQLFIDSVLSQWNYYIRDHLGNTRVVLDEKGNTKQVYDYYPFGLTLRDVISEGEKARYRFTGKELDDRNGLNWYDFGARYYDPAIGRWLSPDPLAKKYPQWSPYNYALNNPFRIIDPDGKDVIGINVGIQFGFLGGGGAALQFVYDTSNKKFSLLGSAGGGAFLGGGIVGEAGIIYSPNKTSDLLGSSVEHGINIAKGAGGSVSYIEGIEPTESPIPIGNTKDGITIYKMAEGDKSTDKRAIIITVDVGADVDYHGFKNTTIDLVKTIKNIFKRNDKDQEEDEEN